MTGRDIETITINFPKFLARLTGRRNWQETNGPDSGCGVDYWYATRNGHEAYINIDQDNMTVAVDGETVFAGTLELD